MSMCMSTGCYVLCFQGRAQNTADIGESNDTHTKTELQGNTVSNSRGQKNKGSRRVTYVCLCSAH